MGITELAHFLFPFLTGGSYGSIPGMAIVLALAPVAWWGMLRLAGSTFAVNFRKVWEKTRVARTCLNSGLGPERAIVPLRKLIGYLL